MTLIEVRKKNLEFVVKLLKHIYSGKRRRVHPEIEVGNDVKVLRSSPSNENSAYDYRF